MSSSELQRERVRNRIHRRTRSRWSSSAVRNLVKASSAQYEQRFIPLLTCLMFSARRQIVRAETRLRDIRGVRDFLDGPALLPLEDDRRNFVAQRHDTLEGFLFFPSRRTRTPFTEYATCSSCSSKDEDSSDEGPSSWSHFL